MKKTLILALALVMMIMSFPASCYAAGKPCAEDIEAITGDSPIQMPKESSYLSDYKWMTVSIYKANVYSYTKAGSQIVTDSLDKGTLVRVVAEQNGMSCVTYETASGAEKAGWITSSNLRKAEKSVAYSDKTLEEAAKIISAREEFGYYYAVDMNGDGSCEVIACTDENGYKTEGNSVMLITFGPDDGEGNVFLFDTTDTVRYSGAEKKLFLHCKNDDADDYLTVAVNADGSATVETYCAAGADALAPYVYESADSGENSADRREISAGDFQGAVRRYNFVARTGFRPFEGKIEPEVRKFPYDSFKESIDYLVSGCDTMEDYEKGRHNSYYAGQSRVLFTDADGDGNMEMLSVIVNGDYFWINPQYTSYDSTGAALFQGFFEFLPVPELNSEDTEVAKYKSSDVGLVSIMSAEVDGAKAIVISAKYPENTMLSYQKKYCKLNGYPSSFSELKRYMVLYLTGDMMGEQLVWSERYVFDDSGKPVSKEFTRSDNVRDEYVDEAEFRAFENTIKPVDRISVGKSDGKGSSVSNAYSYLDKVAKEYDAKK